MTVPEHFNAAAYFVDRHLDEGRSERVAIECGDQRVTYHQLAERVNKTGQALRAQFEVRLEERVLLLLPDTPDFASCFFGAIKIGAVPVPVNTLWKTADYRYVLNDTRARVLIVSASLLAQVESLSRDDVPFLEHVVVTDAPRASKPSRASTSGEVRRVCDVHTVIFEDWLEGASSFLEPAPTSKDDAAFWLYSSGSTGFPKGCVHLHHDMVVCAQAYAANVVRMMEGDRIFSVAKLFFAYGLGNALYMPLSVGATSILWPGPPTAADIYRIVETHRPTLFFSVPTGYAMLLAHEADGRADFDFTSVRHAVSAGEALPPAIFERFRDRFHVDILDGIGSTETLHMFISNFPGAIRPGSSGQVIAGYEARILDEDRRPVPTGEIGNLYIRGDSICAAYWNKHDKTKDTIEGHWIRTGDKFSQDADGYFWYAGRSDDMLKVGGQWVSPVEVENALVQHAAVQECAVVGREDDDRLVKPCAFVVVRAGKHATDALAQELKQFVRTRLAEYKRPRWVEFVDGLPKTATGKIQRFKLRERSN